MKIKMTFDLKEEALYKIWQDQGDGDMPGTGEKMARRWIKNLVMGEIEGLPFRCTVPGCFASLHGMNQVCLRHQD